MLTVERCVMCFDLTRRDDLSVVTVDGKEVRVCLCCAALQLGPQASCVIERIGSGREYHTIRLVADAWEKVGQRLRAIEEYEGRKAACPPVKQLEI